jgi:hypothetical protein
MDSPRSRLPLELAIFPAYVCPLLSPPISASKANLPTMEICFSPTGGATSHIVRERYNANRETLVQAYSFISAPIA